MTNFSRREFNRVMTGSAGFSLFASHAAGAEAKPPKGSFTDVPGIKVGHFTDSRRPTGCTAILFEEEAAVGVDYDGSAPGDHLGVMLQPVSPIERIHAMLLAGAGPFGLFAVQGVERYLEEHKQGFDWGIPNVRIPIVVGAVIDDLAVGDARIRPGPEEAYKACQLASSSPVNEGNVGIGAGATVGKMLVSQGIGGMKGGLGCASRRFGDVVIGALVVSNSVGEIRDWHSGEVLAGARRPDGQGFVNIVETLAKNISERKENASIPIYDSALRSTTLALGGDQRGIQQDSTHQNSHDGQHRGSPSYQSLSHNRRRR